MDLHTSFGTCADPRLNTVSSALTEHVIAPFQTEVIQPLTADVHTALEDYFYTPLGLSPPWNPNPDSDSGDNDSKLTADTVKGSDDFEVHYLDVGQGLSVLVRSGDHALLYDGGDRSHSSFVVAYLKRQGITKLDYLIASHYDADHLSGLIVCCTPRRSIQYSARLCAHFQNVYILSKCGD